MIKYAPRMPLKSQLRRFILNLKFQLHDTDFQNGNMLFFVTGRGKSGTTWMAELLTTHPSLFCDPAENFGFHQDFQFQHLADWPEFLFDGVEANITEKTWKLIKNGLITNLRNKCNKLSAQKLGDKTPDQDILRILDLFPKTQVIVMLRDFRDACVSLAFHGTRLSNSWRGLFDGPEKKYLDNKFLKAVLTYYETKKDFELYSRLATEKPDQVLIVRYEEMKSEPLSTLRGVFEFLGVDSRIVHVRKCLELNTFQKRAKGRRPGDGDSKSFYRKGIIGDWKNHFSPENIALFKEISGDTLIEAGYVHNNQWGL